MSGTRCLLKWGELSSKFGASCLMASLMWGELSLGRVVLIPITTTELSKVELIHSREIRRYLILISRI